MAIPASGERYVGLISGTSMDGIDAVVVDLDGDRPRPLAGLTHPFDDCLREALDAVRRDPDHFPVARLGQLDAQAGDAFARAALEVIARAGLAPGDIRAIGSHGQTIVHHAETDPPFTLQIGDPHRIARRTGVTTVADFRRADLAAGGQGAPLAPLLHDALFRDEAESRAIVNLGGIANVTLLQPGRPVTGFDTGPANCFLDLWFRRHHPSGRYDDNGDWSAGGRVDPEWLATLMDDPYFRRAPPKSTGIEYFSPRWLESRLPDWAGSRPRDVQATLAEWTACSLVEAVEAAAEGVAPRLIVCGGGAGNSDLIGRIHARMDGHEIEPSDRFGLPADLVEATLFAWLAQRRMGNHRIDTRPITGALDPVLLGVIVPASPV